MDLSTALQMGREEAAKSPEGPWPAVLAELERLLAIEQRAIEVRDVKEKVDNLEYLGLYGAARYILGHSL